MCDFSNLVINTPLGNESSYATPVCDVSKCRYLRLTLYSDTPLNIQVIFSHSSDPDDMLWGLQQNFDIHSGCWLTRRVEVVLPFIQIKISKTTDVPNSVLVLSGLARCCSDISPISSPSGVVTATDIPSPSGESSVTPPPEQQPTPSKKSKSILSLPSSIKSEPRPLSENASSPLKIDQKQESALGLSSKLVEKEKEEDPSRGKSPFRSILSRKKSGASSSAISSQQINCCDPRLPNIIPKGGLMLGGFNNSVVTIPPPQQGIDSYLCYIDGQFEWQTFSEKKLQFKIE